MPIHPLPQYEADLEEDRRIYESLKAPTSIVVRFGAMKMVGEFAYSGEDKPGCGSRIVVRTHRGTELGEMLTSTCPNAGCSKSVTRKEMLEYIENSGGKDYPFFTQGRALRIATLEDLNEQARLDGMKPRMTRAARTIAEHMRLEMKIVEAEPILGQERLTFHFTSENRVDFRDLVNELAREFQARIEMHQVGARDEARLTADYERCGQHCCCKQFLKVLKPVSMKQAKIQKATLDPLKISGRCGRLMCCLRYEEQTYDQLRARLPRKKSRVQTPDGWGTVLDGQILTQLVLVQLDSTGEQIAVAIEELITGGTPPPLPPPATLGGPPGARRPEGRPPARRGDGERRGGRPEERDRPPVPPDDVVPESEEGTSEMLTSARAGAPTVGDEDTDDLSAPERGRPAPVGPQPDARDGRGGRDGEGGRRRRRRRGRGPRPDGGTGGPQAPNQPGPRPQATFPPQGGEPTGQDQGGGGFPGTGPSGQEGNEHRRRKRRRRRRGGPGAGPQGGPGAPGGGTPPSSPPPPPGHGGP